MTNKNKIPVYAMFIALTTALSLSILIPIPGTNGFVTPIGIGVFSAAMLFGPVGGLAVGGLSGLLIDLISGFPQWAIFSVIIHGFTGWLVGFLLKKFGERYQFLWLSIGSIAMIVGYFCAGWILYGFGVGLASIPSNIFQNLIGIIGAYPLVAGLRRALPQLTSTNEKRRNEHGHN